MLSSLDNAGTIGLTGSGKSEEESAYGIDNVGTINEITNEGEIEGSTNSINNESGGQIGTSSTTGIKNTGEIQTIENAGTIGMTGGIGIEDATGEITTISNVKGGEIEGTGIKNESGSKGIKTITNEGAVSSIENEGTIGGSGNYGIDNAGDIGQINDGGSSSLEGTIEGTEAGINNESGGSLSLGAQKAIEGTGSSNATSKEYGIENAGTITNLNIVEGESIKGETTGIYNEKTITTLTNEGTSGDIDNAGTIGTLENEGGGQIGTITNEKGDTIKELTNEGTIGGSGNYGIDNAGDIGQINDGGSSSLEGTIEGTEAGINNESGGSLSLGAQKAIEGTGNSDATSKEYGIENAGQITDILSIEKGETIKGTTNAIYNTGAIYGISTESGAVLSSLDNAGTIGATGSGENVYGIQNAGTINTIEVENGGEIEGTLSGIENEGTIGISTKPSDGTNTGAIENAGTISSINNTGVIGGTGDSYGIDNQGGTIGQIENGSSSSSDSESTTQNAIIQGTTYGIENEAGGQIGNEAGEDGIDNYGTITGIEDAGTIGIGSTIDAIYNIGTINTIAVEKGGVITGKEGLENEGTIGVVASPSDETGTGAIENAGTISSINNTGTIGGNSYGIDNQGGTIGGVTNGAYGSKEGDIQGTTFGIYNETGGQITEKNQVYGDGIYNYGTINEIENAGTIGTSSAVNAIYNGGTARSW